MRLENRSHRLLIFYSSPRFLASRPCCHPGLRPGLGLHSPCWLGQLSRRVLKSHPVVSVECELEWLRENRKGKEKEGIKGKKNILPSFYGLTFSPLAFFMRSAAASSIFPRPMVMRCRLEDVSTWLGCRRGLGVLVRVTLERRFDATRHTRFGGHNR